MTLVMALNTLLASPAFAAWTEGLPMDMDRLLGNDDDPRATIVSIAHLDETQRLFVITLLVAELVAWMRRQPASSGLRALLYMDEVQGIMPPHPANPPTKGPLLTLFKQGRAYGVGAWVATQNPVDLDYKALGNAGVKMVGRLITDRDRERALEGLGLNELPDGRDADEVVAALGKREFLLTDVRAEQRVRSFSSRWAMSYLRGPVTLAEVGPLVAGQDEPAAAAPSPAAQPKSTPSGRSQPPPLSVSVETVFAADGAVLAAPHLLVKSRLSVQRTTLNLYRELREVWLVPLRDDGRLRWDEAQLLDEMPDVDGDPPEGMTFPKAVPGGLAGQLKKAETEYRSWRARRPLQLLLNSKLKLVAEAGEAQEDFLQRCLEAADLADDDDEARLRKRFESKLRTLKKRLAREQDELDRDRDQLEARKAEEKIGMVEGIFSVLLGSRSISSASRKAAAKFKSAASKRRMRQGSQASVVESENEIERLEAEIEDLADDLQEELERMEAASEEKAEQIEEKAVKAKKADVEVLELFLYWG